MFCPYWDYLPLHWSPYNQVACNSEVLESIICWSASATDPVDPSIHGLKHVCLSRRGRWKCRGRRGCCCSGRSGCRCSGRGCGGRGCCHTGSRADSGSNDRLPLAIAGCLTIGFWLVTVVIARASSLSIPVATSFCGCCRCRSRRRWCSWRRSSTAHWKAIPICTLATHLFLSTKDRTNHVRCRCLPSTGSPRIAWIPSCAFTEAKVSDGRSENDNVGVTTGIWTEGASSTQATGFWVPLVIDVSLGLIINLSSKVEEA